MQRPSNPHRPEQQSRAALHATPVVWQVQNPRPWSSWRQNPVQQPPVERQESPSGAQMQCRALQSSEQHWASVRQRVPLLRHTT